jgi:YbbR domain-containing protein
MRSLLQENLNYKVMALLIAIILWITILGRRDFVYTTNVALSLKSSRGTKVVLQTADRVQLRISGPRMALRRFIDNPENQEIALDISGRPPGVHEIDIPLHQLEIPLGVKVLSFRPASIRFETQLESGKKETQ